jgi:hypothetical protein
MTTTSKPRTRRVGATSAAARAVPENIRNLMTETYLNNRAKNAATRAEEAARKNLLAAMDADGRSSAMVSVTVDDPANPGKTIPVGLTAEVATPLTEVVDVHKLVKLVSLEDFLKVAKATKTDVEKMFGKAVFARCRIENKGETNVKVTLTK